VRVLYSQFPLLSPLLSFLFPLFFLEGVMMMEMIKRRSSKMTGNGCGPDPSFFFSCLFSFPPLFFSLRGVQRKRHFWIMFCGPVENMVYASQELDDPPSSLLFLPLPSFFFSFFLSLISVRRCGCHVNATKWSKKWSPWCAGSFPPSILFFFLPPPLSLPFLSLFPFFPFFFPPQTV